ncbi:MFS transporter [Flavilitoribacter nigricans]|uniref:MFS transporter n=1 Tax=Flavilitoribacter nigricans (strain ATCC 23147 / DSM 23189 / NBRC 102662 / NCIMB 1420 / SS-2) TaxID=1122177 RepID=A0A2D0NCG9_FLAN2|nr:MFS transporter [Flavilitoribacter nigricans]PHN06201.1 MFS transporter [Flavilitoribacter nigricans DSM 23189 = NBRC 102662]
MGKMVKITLLLASTLTVMAGAAIAPALPTISVHFAEVPRVDLLTKLLLTLPALFIALFSPVIGYLLDRFGKMSIFQASMLLYIVAGSAGFVLSSLPLLLVSRALLGIAVAGVMTTAVTLAGDYFEGEERNKFLGTQAAVMAFGGTVFVTFSGLLADFGWRFPFLIYTLALPVLILVRFYLTEPEVSDEQKQDALNGNKSLGDKVPALILIYATAFLGMVAFYLIPVQSPFLLKEIGAERPSMQSVGLVLATIMAALMAQNYARLLRFLGYRGIFAFCFGIMAVGFIITATAGQYYQAVIGLFLAGGGAGLLMPNSNTWLMQLSPPSMRGRFMGAMTMAIFLGQFFSPVFFQPLVRIQGLQGAHLTGGLFLLGMAVLYVINGIYQARK